jgi:2'-5' RNA ligase
MDIHIALDIALIPPLRVRQRAVALSASLPAPESKGLRLDDAHLPHVTLTQQFVRTADLPEVIEAIGHLLRDRPPMPLRIGGGGGRGTVWMTIEKSGALLRLHEDLMRTLKPWEQMGGTAGGFYEGDARTGDVAWVRGFRALASFERFAPHITLGHAATSPDVEPIDFQGDRIAACHLGRFCTCRRVLHEWTLGGT